MSGEGYGLNERLARELCDQRPEAIDHLLATYGPRLQAVAYLILGSPADAEEIVIDTMVTAWRQGRQLRDPDALSGWLLRIATRHALSRRRSIGATLPLLPSDAEQIIGDAGPTINRVALMEALASLPRQMRAAVVLHYYVDLTVDGVAAALGRSPNTIKSQLREGLTRLRGQLDDPEGRRSA